MGDKLVKGNIVVYGFCSFVWFINGFRTLITAESSAESGRALFLFVIAVFYGIVSLLNLYLLKKH